MLNKNIIYLVSDIWNAKLAMLIPFTGLIISNVNNIIQCYFMEFNIHWLLISDLIYGCVGGFPAIIGINNYFFKEIYPIIIYRHAICIQY